MASKTGLASLAGLLALTVTACGGDDKPKASPSPESPKPTGSASYGTVIELRDAAVAAGYECAGWVQDNVVTLAAESGHCSDEDVFATFASEGDLQQQLEKNRSTNDLLKSSGIDPDPTLVGPNWSISGPNVSSLSVDLGGTVSR